MEFLKKTWKFFLGIIVTVIGGMLLFRKDDTGKIIKESTAAGDNALKSVLDSNQEKNKKDLAIEAKSKAEIRMIHSKYEKNKKNLNLKMRKKVEDALRKGDAKSATEQLAKFLGAENLDDV